MVVANWPLFSHTFYKGLDLQLLKNRISTQRQVESIPEAVGVGHPVAAAASRVCQL